MLTSIIVGLVVVGLVGMSGLAGAVSSALLSLFFENK